MQAKLSLRETAAFEVNDAGYIVDSNGQFLLGYPVDNDGCCF